MADYTPTTWVDDDGSGTVGTLVSAARMNAMETAIEDAAEHNKRGLLSARPAAAAANKNWLYFATDVDGGTLYHSDGSQWTAVRKASNYWAAVNAATIAPLPAHTRSGNVLTASANGALSVDSLAVSAGQRVLVMQEATAHLKHGVYDVTQAGSAGTPWILTRSADADSADEFFVGKTVYVMGGSVLATFTFQLKSMSADPPTLNSTTFAFSSLGPDNAFMESLMHLSTASSVRSAIAAAPLASPAFTGNPTAPTPAAGDNDTSIATTAYVQGELADHDADLGSFFGPNGIWTLVANASATANAMHHHRIVIPVPALLTGIAVFNGGTVSGNFRVVLLDAAGNRVAQSNSTAQSGANAAQLVPFTAQYQAAAGIYYLGLVRSSATSQVTHAITMGPAASLAQASFTTPTSITPPTTPFSTSIALMTAY